MQIVSKAHATQVTLERPATGVAGGCYQDSAVGIQRLDDVHNAIIITTYALQ